MRVLWVIDALREESQEIDALREESQEIDVSRQVS